MRTFAQDLGALSTERLLAVGPGHLVDRVPQIHSPHIGDARSGKWRQLPDPVKAELTLRFAAFLERFGYSG